MKKLIITLVGAIGLLYAGFLAAKYISDSSYGTADLVNGEETYAANCLACHGEKGLGDGPVSHTMTVKPDNIYLELTNPWGFKAELIASVLEGDNGQDGSMPAFKQVLSESDINDIFGYIVDINTIE